jgi:hypothetical protein
MQKLIDHIRFFENCLLLDSYHELMWFPISLYHKVNTRGLRKLVGPRLQIGNSSFFISFHELKNVLFMDLTWSLVVWTTIANKDILNKQKWSIKKINFHWMKIELEGGTNVWISHFVMLLLAVSFRCYSLLLILPVEDRVLFWFCQVDKC